MRRMTILRLAFATDAESLPGLNDRRPPLLVSFVIAKQFLSLRESGRLTATDWVMDSGAFSAHNSGKEVKLSEFIGLCRELAADETLKEVFALDVIGDHAASLRNCEAMWKAGIEAIPTFHVGSHMRELRAIAKDYPKIALGGMVGYRQRKWWAQQCFARIWPKRVHGFGFTGRSEMLSCPFESVDSTSWHRGPQQWGEWMSFRHRAKVPTARSERYGSKVTIRASGGKSYGEVLNQGLLAELDYYRRLSELAAHRWRRELQELR
jgi:hypothetical protein